MTQDELLTLGRERGYVTLEEITQAFPEAESDLDRLDQVYDMLLEDGIEVGTQAEEDEDEESAEPDDQDQQASIEADDMVGLYLREAGRTPLLSAAQELDLAQRMERGRQATKQLARNGTSPKRRGQLEAAVADGQVALDQLVKANSRLVVSIAKRYMDLGLPLLDLIQEGNIGLIRAAQRFDYHRGWKFSTYATWWIRQAVTRAISDQARTIRLPVHVGEQLGRLKRMSSDLFQKLGRDPTNRELAQALKMPEDKVDEMLQMGRQPISLETPADEDEDSEFGDLIEDASTPAPEEIVFHNLLREQVQERISLLPPREARVLQLRYGLEDGQAHTLDEVGRMLGVTRERVRQLEAQALSRLRHPADQRGLVDYLRR